VKLSRISQCCLLVDVASFLEPFTNGARLLSTLAPGQIDQTDLAYFLTRHLAIQTPAQQSSVTQWDNECILFQNNLINPALDRFVRQDWSSPMQKNAWRCQCLVLPTDPEMDLYGSAISLTSHVWSWVMASGSYKNLSTKSNFSRMPQANLDLV